VIENLTHEFCARKQLNLFVSTEGRVLFVVMVKRRNPAPKRMSSPKQDT
jgi:hypothetical protein